MSQTNFERMLQLADEVFATKNDPNQLDVNEEVLERLQQIHSATVNEFENGNGPVAWVLLLPTTMELMLQFLAKKISEKELYELTPLDSKYEAIYLCSAMVLEEYRRKGISKKLALDAITSIRKDYSIKSLFVWSFSKEGDLASEAISKWTGLPLYKLES